MIEAEVVEEEAHEVARLRHLKLLRQLNVGCSYNVAYTVGTSINEDARAVFINQQLKTFDSRDNEN